MNESFRLPVFVLGALLALAGCRSETPLEGATLGGPFALTSHEGRRVSDSDFAGRYRLVYFGFASCPDVCPTDLQTIGAGLRRFEADAPGRAQRVVPLFVTVDPARDTPEVLARYVAAFHPRLIGLTGSEEEIARVARAHGVAFRRGDPAPGGAYLVDHARFVLLYGPQGAPIAIVPHDKGPDAVAAELDRWVR